jgi:hypothetical protein
LDQGNQETAAVAVPVVPSEKIKNIIKRKRRQSSITENAAD